MDSDHPASEPPPAPAAPAKPASPAPTPTPPPAPAPKPTAPVPEGYVRLISGDGYDFLVEIRHACVSKVIKKILESDFREAQTREIRFPDADAAVLEKVCQYMYYLPRQVSLKASTSHDRVVEQFEIPRELTVKMLLFASFLDI